MVKIPQIVGERWFNSPPLKSPDLAGKAVLVDFWTYSCANCQRTLPYLREWWGKYKGMNFLLIGIHTPEFEFEKDPKNLEQAIKNLQVKWPVVMDNDYANWNNFSNHYWPAKYLADQEGRIVYTHFGEGAYAETERVIQKLLVNQDKTKAMPTVVEEHEHSHSQVCFIPTPETYCGYARGRLYNDGGYRESELANYQFAGRPPLNAMALSGKFFAAPEYVESAERGASLFLHFRATEVNLVLHPVGEKAVIQVIFNDQPPDNKMRGRDVNLAGEVKIAKPTLYNPLKSKSLLEGIVRLVAKEGNFQAYAFTFSGCED